MTLTPLETNTQIILVMTQTLQSLIELIKQLSEKIDKLEEKIDKIKPIPYYIPYPQPTTFPWPDIITSPTTSPRPTFHLTDSNERKTTC